LVWHLTHRCHAQDFLLRFARDRARYLHWLFEARKRYGLCLLDYVVTSNHVHLLVKDTGQDTIARSIQLAAGRTAQEFNGRKSRQGAFWEDRYHATAVETGEHLSRCITYIDLNMVRAGVVAHPRDWPHGGYAEMRRSPLRYRLVDEQSLQILLGLNSPAHLRDARCEWIAAALETGLTLRDSTWSESLAVGSTDFTARVQKELGARARSRKVIATDNGAALREPAASYRVKNRLENRPARSENTYLWDVIFY
jgi:putative transposase